MTSFVSVVLLAFGALIFQLPPSSSTVKAALSENGTEAFAAQSEQTLEDQIIGLEKASWVAWQGHDSKFFESFLTSDHVEVGNAGVAGKKAVVTLVGSSSCTVRSYSLDHFAFRRISSNVVLLNYRATQDTVCNGKLVPSPAWATSLFVQRNRQWANVLYQHSAQ